MAEFFASNLGTIIVLLILAAVVFLIVRSIVKDKKKGKSTCGSNCAHCAMSGTCHGK
ncbi:MAG: FeoB-associated Cys-rich membrane protein [Lachnospiraceae bacterium]|nr:FeoB-associated Cys-rich membrane protein [Lachnospiraceae bacterium]